MTLSAQSLYGGVRTWAGEQIPGPGPGRQLALLTLVQSVGLGAFLSSSALFLTGVAGLSSGQVGTGLSLAGVCGALASTLAGAAAGRFGTRVPLALTYAATAVLFVLYGTVGSYLGFLLLACGISIGEGAAEPLRATLVHALSRGTRASLLRAQMRSVLNIGFIAGSGLATLALLAGTREAFLGVFLGNACAHVCCALLTLRLRPPQEDVPPPAQPGSRRSGRAFTDVRFLLLTLVNGALEVHQVVVTVIVPLWIVTSTRAPAWLNAVLLVLNTVVIIATQVRVGRRIDTLASAGAMQVRGGILLGVSCCAAALSAVPGVALPVTALVVSALVLAVGELCQVASALQLSYDLPPPGRQAEYQGVFAFRKGLRQAVGPALLTWLVIGHGATGWLVLGGCFAVLGLLGGRLVTLSAAAREDAPPA
ncbi:MFS transporter [Streptomyces telluris]|uniref:MFS transporter n=1 Tax=Streptomyces telluris TaxID=2720021 RepID=A0A9X2LQQ7_9ACTN|nr:MFS transporter [Streptomyces telluris]MCQ8773900.1 MFS transporter [Streptomyces telluris]NJP77682.1 MFS transporter [Streptomyces telluris]